MKMLMLLLLAMVMAAACAEDTTIIDQQTVPTPTPTRTPSWTEVVQWQGSSIKDTETFSISSHDWRIRWETKLGQYGFAMNFQIYVFTAGGEVKSIAANAIGAARDVSYVRGARDYYLTINTAQPYSVVVEQRE